MELKPYDAAAAFPFGTLLVRDVTPESCYRLSMAVVEVPIGAEHPPFAENRNEKVYVGLKGQIEFTCGDEKARIGHGDILVFKGGEQYSYHNGGYEPGRLLVLQRPTREDDEARA